MVVVAEAESLAGTSSEVDDDTLYSVAQGVQQLIVLTDTLPADGTTPADDSFTASAAQTSLQAAPAVSHVYVRAAGETPRNRIRTAHLPAGRYPLTVSAEDFAHNIGTQEVTIEILP